MVTLPSELFLLLLALRFHFASPHVVTMMTASSTPMPAKCKRMPQIPIQTLQPKSQ
tara:strand:+ start:4365 stop:4532 length:168 start_codon:yes stop_codon:yes gene_type:complete